MEDILYMVGFSAVFSLIFALFWRYMLDYRRDSRISRIEGELDHLTDAINGFRGNQVKAENKEAEQAFMVQAKAILDGEGEMKDKMMKVFAMNPMMAMKIAKKMGLSL